MVTRIHITQDDYGYWMTVRQTGLGLVVETWGAESSSSVLDEVWELADMEVFYSQSGAAGRRRTGDDAYALPEPRRARRPYTRHRTTEPRPEARA